MNEYELNGLKVLVEYEKEMEYLAKKIDLYNERLKNAKTREREIFYKVEVKDAHEVLEKTRVRINDCFRFYCEVFGKRPMDVSNTLDEMLEAEKE